MEDNPYQNNPNVSPQPEGPKANIEPTQPTYEKDPRQRSYDYAKKPLWQWILICLVIGGVAIGLVYYFLNLRIYNSQQVNNNQNNQNNQQPVSAGNIAISSAGFAPNAVTIKKGESVTWMNNDDATHMISSSDKNGPSSPDLKKGDSWTLPFPETGTFTYQSSSNPTWKATIVVTE